MTSYLRNTPPRLSQGTEDQRKVTEVEVMSLNEISSGLPSGAVNQGNVRDAYMYMYLQNEIISGV